MDRDRRVGIDWNAELVEQLDLHWNVWFRPRLEGLTDHEYLWEPVEGCWSVRPDEHGTPRLDGLHHMDDAPDPPPFTTIAWRMAHIASMCAVRASGHFGDGRITYDDLDWPLTAAGGVAFVEGAYAQWRDGIRSLGEDGLFCAVGSLEGPYANHAMGSLVLHMSREIIHHAAEVCCLRDLYRDRNGRALTD